MHAARWPARVPHVLRLAPAGTACSPQNSPRCSAGRRGSVLWAVQAGGATAELCCPCAAGCRRLAGGLPAGARGTAALRCDLERRPLHQIGSRNVRPCCTPQCLAVAWPTPPHALPSGRFCTSHALRILNVAHRAAQRVLWAAAAGLALNLKPCELGWARRRQAAQRRSGAAAAAAGAATGWGPPPLGAERQPGRPAHILRTLRRGCWRASARSSYTAASLQITWTSRRARGRGHPVEAAPPRFAERRDIDIPQSEGMWTSR
jgi:hypothetical protein